VQYLNGAQNMMMSIKRLHQLICDEKGATVIEYALIAALVAIVAIAGLTLLGTNVNSKMTTIASSIGT
jgi:pilus assembly protein Flp/PilA